MDPLSALALAAAVAQLIDFGWKVAKRLDEYSSRNPADAPRSLQAVCTQLPPPHEHRHGGGRGRHHHALHPARRRRRLPQPGRRARGHRGRGVARARRQPARAHAQGLCQPEEGREGVGDRAQPADVRLGARAAPRRRRERGAAAGVRGDVCLRRPGARGGAVRRAAAGGEGAGGGIERCGTVTRPTSVGGACGGRRRRGQDAACSCVCSSGPSAGPVSDGVLAGRVLHGEYTQGPRKRGSGHQTFYGRIAPGEAGLRAGISRRTVAPLASGAGQLRPGRGGRDRQPPSVPGVRCHRFALRGRSVRKFSRPCAQVPFTRRPGTTQYVAR